MEKIELTSDNWAPASPEVLQSMIAANHAYAAPYGQDQYTADLQEVFSSICEKDVEVIPVPTSSSGNALGLSFCTRSYGCIVGEERSHIMMDEAGAPEFFSGGVRMLGIKGDMDGKISVQNLQQSPIDEWLEDSGSSKPQVVSLGQITDCGTAYTSEEIRLLSNFCKERGLYLHLDGTRFANSLARFGGSMADFTWKVGVDVMTFGMTKNGGLSCDAVIVFSDALREESWRMLKRSGGTFSKMRFASSQLIAYVQDGLWLKRAEHANNLTQILLQKLKSFAGVELLYTVDGNMIFAQIDSSVRRHLETKLKFGKLSRTNFQFPHKKDAEICRFVCPWSLSEDKLKQALSEV